MSGTLSSMLRVMGVLPGGLGAQFQNMEVDEKHLIHIEAMIYSMTSEERQDPDMIDGRRRSRIARGSGTSIQEVNQLLRQFREMKIVPRNYHSQLLWPNNY